MIVPALGLGQLGNFGRQAERGHTMHAGARQISTCLRIAARSSRSFSSKSA
jgi:hypothetical protein